MNRSKGLGHAPVRAAAMLEALWVESLELCERAPRHLRATVVLQQASCVGDVGDALRHAIAVGALRAARAVCAVDAALLAHLARRFVR